MEYKDYNALKIKVDQGVAFVTIDNGDVNLMDLSLLTDLQRFYTDVLKDDDIRVIVLQSANPDFFIAHYDVSLINAPPNLKSWKEYLWPFRESSKITVAKIEGRIGGGGNEFTLFFDMRFGAIGKAIFHQAEAFIGIIAGGGGVVFGAKKMGRARALETQLGCYSYSAELAEKYGWINRALPANEIGPFIEQLAYRMATIPPETVKLIKKTMKATEELPLGEALIQESILFVEAANLPESKRRMSMFVNGGGQSKENEMGSEDDVQK
jgi:enoyl-CoA hydratase/carnithine racemase